MYFHEQSERIEQLFDTTNWKRDTRFYHSPKCLLKIWKCTINPKFHLNSGPNPKNKNLSHVWIIHLCILSFLAKNSTCMIKAQVIKCKDIIDVIFHLPPSMINGLKESGATCWIMLCVKGCSKISPKNYA